MTTPAIAWIWLGMATWAVAGSAAEAERIRGEYRAGMTAWMEQLRGAGTVDEQRAAWEARPDTGSHARRMWECIGGDLAQPWSLKPAAWLLRMSVALRGAGAGAAGGNDWAAATTAIRGAVEKHHLRSVDPGLIPMCMALVDVADPHSLAILEKIESGHPDKKVQGVAALAISMLLKTLGDEGDVMLRRLSMLRKAIIESAEIEIDGIPIAKVAEDELYVIRHLSKGRVAPDLVGRDVAGRPMKLSDYEGKVVVLMFWGTWSGDTERLLEVTGKLLAGRAEKPFALVGVNSDPAPTLRKLVAGGVVDWPNFSDPERKLSAEYRVAAWPLALVLDRKRVIRYIGAPGSFVELTVDAILGDG